MVTKMLTNKWVIFSIYFVVIMCLSVFVRDISGQYNVFTTTVMDIIIESQMGDPKYFATAALDISKNGWISNPNTWIFNLWPPGFILLEALIIKIFGVTVPILLVLQFILSILYAILFLIFYNDFKISRYKIVSFLFPLILFLFPFSRVFLLQPVGITLGESFSIAFFLIAILLAIKSIKSEKILYAIYSGIFIGVSTYFRSQFEILLLGMSAGLVILIILIQFKIFKNIFDDKIIKKSLKSIIVILIVAHALMIPWRFYHYYNHGSPSWVYTSSNTYANAVKTSEELRKLGGGFVVDGGGNLVCRINPITCGDMTNAKEHFFRTLFNNPIEWYSIKLDILGKYWFSSEENWVSVYYEAGTLDYISNSFILTMLISIFYLMLKKNILKDKYWIMIGWLIGSLFFSYLIIFTVQQFEVRYFYFPKIIILIFFLILIVINKTHPTEKGI